MPLRKRRWNASSAIAIILGVKPPHGMSSMSVERLSLDANILFYTIDAMQWAVAKQAGATLLLSEDLQHDRELEGVRFRNPFLVEDPFEA